ncbi:hypothetical protein OAP63_00755 [Vibrio sp.]|nr:hypothetical protein [Vibrio sp.]
MFLHFKDKWTPDAVDLHHYSDDCEYWRQGVSLHVLRQNISEEQKELVSRLEFEDGLDNFQELNDHKTLRCQSSVSGSEVSAQILSECLMREATISDVDYLIYCHRGIDLEFYSSPACRAQNALQNKKIIPFSVSQCGTSAGMYGLDLANTLAQQGQKGVVVVLSELGIMPIRRRILRDTLVNDGASVLLLNLDRSGVEIEYSDVRQFASNIDYSSDLLGAYSELLQMATDMVGSIDDALHILPYYSRDFKEKALSVLRCGPNYLFENRDDGYSGINFPANALQEFIDSSANRAIILQVSETGAGAFIVIKKVS